MIDRRLRDGTKHTVGHIGRSWNLEEVSATLHLVISALISIARNSISAMGVVAGRSKVATTFGIVAASQPLAAQAGVQMLERGGHAVDAAIAANAVMTVVEPEMNGLGGDLFAIVSEAKGSALHGLNAGGWAPAGLTLDVLRKRGLTEMPIDGIHTVTVPGAVAGWDALHKRFGRLPMADLLAPAIFYAEHGFPVTDIIASRWATWV